MQTLEPSINGLLNVIDKVSAERDSNIKRLSQCLDKDIAELGRELKEIKSQANVRLSTSTQPYTLRGMGKMSMMWRVPGQEVDQRKLGERLWKKTVKHVD